MTTSKLSGWLVRKYLTLLLLWFGFFSQAMSRDVVYGINFDVVSTDTRQIKNCTTDPNATVPKQAFMARYSSESVRNAVQAKLKDLRSSGFRIVRTIVQLYPGDHSSGDLTNIYRIDESVIDAIRKYVADVRDSGFDSLIIAFDAQGTASPGCRIKQWGDCFDSVTVSSSVDAEEKIMRATQEVGGLSVRVDLLNEACPSDRIPPLLKENFETFIRAAAKRHSTAYPAIPATISCQVGRASDGLAATARLMAESGDRMSFVDVHAYPGDSNEADALRKAARSASIIKIPFIFGETLYGDRDYQHLIINAFQAAFSKYPDELLFWPVRSLSNQCHFDVAQPYQLSEALGH